MRRSATDCAAHAAPFIPHPAPSPASQAAHPTQCAGLCGAHTVGPRSLHGGARRYRGADGTRFLRSDRTGGVSPRGPPAHTQPHNCTWPTLRRTPPSQETCTPSGNWSSSVRLVACASSALRLPVANAPGPRGDTFRKLDTALASRALACSCECTRGCPPLMHVLRSAPTPWLCLLR